MFNIYKAEKILEEEQRLSAERDQEAKKAIVQKSKRVNVFIINRTPRCHDRGIQKADRKLHGWCNTPITGNQCRWLKGPSCTMMSGCMTSIVKSSQRRRLRTHRPRDHSLCPTRLWPCKLARTRAGLDASDTQIPKTREWIRAFRRTPFTTLSQMKTLTRPFSRWWDADKSTKRLLDSSSISQGREFTGFSSLCKIGTRYILRSTISCPKRPWKDQSQRAAISTTPQSWSQYLIRINIFSQIHPWSQFHPERSCRLSIGNLISRL